MDILANEQIISIVEERCLHPGPFEEFTARLLDLQVIRQTYDVVSDELFFYSADQLLLHLHATDLKGYSNSQSCEFADQYNQSILEKSLEDFDSGKISVVEFHRQLALAGIVYVSVHIPTRKVYYLSQDGQFYLETF
jgi:uncharacterized protein YbcV (DUF1398 family)